MPPQVHAAACCASRETQGEGASTLPPIHHGNVRALAAE